jgi:hypothetical protein
MRRWDRITLALCISFAMTCQLAARIQNTEEVRAPEITLDVVVTDEQGTPVKGVEVGGYFSGPFASAPDKAKTDVDGRVVLRGKATLQVSLASGGDGTPWYLSSLDIIPEGIDADKQGWNIKREGTLILRKKRNPTPLAVRRIELVPPSLEKPYAYDLEIGDYVQPYGKGKTPDLVFRSVLLRNDGPMDLDYRLDVSFSNLGDGIISTEQNLWCTLRSPHYLAPNAQYKNKWIYTRTVKPGGGGKTSANPNRCFYLRVRTKLDTAGKIMSANYAKIYGDFPKFVYFYNPTPNDRNLEFDPDENLAKDGPRVWMEQFGL